MSRELGIREEARDVVVGDDAVAPSSSRPHETVSRDLPCRTLCEAACWSLLAIIIHLRQPYHQTLARGDVGQHLGKKNLHHLERGDRLAKLQSFWRT
jgi:hypothetical protein